MTGVANGTEALREILEALPPDAPGMVIVQHMPPSFTKLFAKRLDETSALHVVEAKIVLRGERVYMDKWCPVHGSARVLMSDDAGYYRACRETWIKPPEMPLRRNTPNTTIEILTPDFRNKSESAVMAIVEAGPEAIVAMLGTTALGAIWSNKLRSFLTVLGVIIGTGAVIGVGSIIAGLDGAIHEPGEIAARVFSRED